MAYLRYISGGGIVEMGGGKSPSINITRLSGFGLPPQIYETVEFATENGVTTTGKKDGARTITISGDLLGGQNEIIKMLKAFYYEGELFCCFGRIERKIGCKCINLGDIERHNNCGINGFTVQLQCDYPYFTDFQEISHAIVGYRNLVTETFTLPCVFTEVLQEGEIHNSGDMSVFPRILITTSTEPAEDDNLLSLINETTGAVIKLRHVLQKNETINIDLNERRITSDLSGDLSREITSDTVLSDFYFATGTNKIKFNSSDTSQSVSAVASYNRLYLMAER